MDPVTTVSYDAAYVADRYGRYTTTFYMSELRLDFVETVMRLWDVIPSGQPHLQRCGVKILDVGYGNGAFIREARRACWDAEGCDVNPTEYPNVRRVGLPDPLRTDRRYRAITFFDALEHFESLHEVRRVSACTDWIFVTAPLPPEDWPKGYGNKVLTGGEELTIGKLLPHTHPWKHWRPGEHHHFFHPATLEAIFSWEDPIVGMAVKATLLHVSHFEDVIRGAGMDGRPNTFTAALRCEKTAG